MAGSPTPNQWCLVWLVLALVGVVVNAPLTTATAVICSTIWGCTARIERHWTNGGG